MTRNRQQLELFAANEMTVEPGAMLLRRPGHLPHNGLSPVALHEAGHIVAFEVLGVPWNWAEISSAGRSGFVDASGFLDDTGLGAPNPKTKMLVHLAGKGAQQLTGVVGRKQPIGVFAQLDDTWHRRGLWGDADNVFAAAFELIQYLEEEVKALLIQHWDRVLEMALQLQREQWVPGPAFTSETGD